MPLALLVVALCLVLGGMGPVVRRPGPRGGPAPALGRCRRSRACWSCRPPSPASSPPTGAPDVDAVLLWGYVLTQLLVLPIAAAWAFAERTRWSSVVLLVAALTVAFLEYRLLQIWGTV